MSILLIFVIGAIIFSISISIVMDLVCSWLQSMPDGDAQKKFRWHGWEVGCGPEKTSRIVLGLTWMMIFAGATAILFLEGTLALALGIASIVFAIMIICTTIVLAMATISYKKTGGKSLFRLSLPTW
jgi:hypothetical protein